ncbi:MAG: transglutaminase-like domain-containing protein [Dehalococcoidales bacterium]|nr:transglutaminase-like domain-containing protein [Dehalococcoidales bacterium]
MLSCLWLKYGRKYWSRLVNLFYSANQPLPSIITLTGVQTCLGHIKYKSDSFMDWIQSPELTWYRRSGDCEDYAVLAIALLKQIGIEGQLLSVICEDKQLSHAVCIFLQDGEYSYFSNSRLVTTDKTQVEEIVARIGGNQVICWSLEDIAGNILVIKRLRS